MYGGPTFPKQSWFLPKRATSFASGQIAFKFFGESY